MYNSMETANRIKELLKSKDMTASAMLASVGLGNNTFSNMKRSDIAAGSLAKIADYIDCSVDYLIGRTENPESHKSQQCSNVNSPNSIAGNDNTYISGGVTYDEMLEKLIHIYNSLDFRNKVQMFSLILERWDV